MRRWINLYFGAAFLTLTFQLWVRSLQCNGLADCGLSFGKAVAWAAIWPVSWIVYFGALSPFNIGQSNWTAATTIVKEAPAQAVTQEQLNDAAVDDKNFLHTNGNYDQTRYFPGLGQQILQRCKTSFCAARDKGDTSATHYLFAPNLAAKDVLVSNATQTNYNSAHFDPLS